MPSHAIFAPAVLCLLVLGASAPAEEETDSSPDQKEKDWLEHYYRDPTPGRFVEKMKDWSEDGTLDNRHAKPPLIAFISQLIRQNRDSLAGWYESLAGLPPEHKQVLLTGMLLSRTSEADALMKERFGKRYEEQKQKTPKILEMALDKRSTLDMLWGFFYATGSEHAIRRIVLCFRFEDAPDDPEGVDVPEGYRPLYKELPAFAKGSLIANGERHSRVVKILEKLYAKEDELVEAEKEGVRDVLSELKPEEFPPREEDKKEKEPEGKKVPETKTEPEAGKKSDA